MGQTTETQAYLTDELIKDLGDRLSRIEGHVRGVKSMLAAHKPCEDILVQLAAIRSALNQVNIKLLDGHIETCIEQCALVGDTRPLASLQEALSLVLRKS
ncbi:MAG: metal-sensitive transcriptional regulator [Candidatus Bipolaricaulia bacterium]